MTVPYLEPEICPHCGVDLLQQPEYRPDGVPQWSEASGPSRAIGIEMNRWDPVRDPRRWEAAEKYRALFTLRERAQS